MPNFIKTYVRYVDAANRLIGRITLYLIFVMIGIMMYCTLSRYFFNTPVLWGVEMTQFVMVAYYMVGGAFSLLLKSHVRMDVFYGRWKVRSQARMDVLTSICMIVYLGLLLYGSISSTVYSIQYNQHYNSAWGPAVAPIKCFMVFGIFMMLLQAFSEFFKEIAKSRGILLQGDIPEVALLEENSSEKIVVEIPSVSQSLPLLTPDMQAEPVSSPVPVLPVHSACPLHSGASAQGVAA